MSFMWMVNDQPGDENGTAMLTDFDQYELL